jgi:hypothetical protein
LPWDTTIPDFSSTSSHETTPATLNISPSHSSLLPTPTVPIPEGQANSTAAEPSTIAGSTIGAGVGAAVVVIVFLAIVILVAFRRKRTRLPRTHIASMDDNFGGKMEMTINPLYEVNSPNPTQPVPQLTSTPVYEGENFPAGTFSRNPEPIAIHNVISDPFYEGTEVDQEQPEVSQPSEELYHSTAPAHSQLYIPLTETPPSQFYIPLTETHPSQFYIPLTKSPPPATPMTDFLDLPRFQTRA